jgi:hypothetical protein
MTPAYKDPFDYKLRNKADVQEEHRLFPPDFKIHADYKNYSASGDTSVSNSLDNRERVVSIFLKYNSIFIG